MSAAPALETLLAKLGSRLEPAERAESRALLAPPAMALGWPSLDAALPDGGFPRGVVELASQAALGGGTSVALTAVRAAHARDPRAWCAWLDPEGTLYGPGVVRVGVDLARLLVVRPPRTELARFAVKVAASHAFDVVVVDFDPVPHAVEGARDVCPPPPAKRKRAVPPEVVVRKLALHAEEGGATIVLLTDARARRVVPWPVALRVELSRPNEHDLELAVTKDKRGRIGVKKTIPFASRPLAAPER